MDLDLDPVVLIPAILFTVVAIYFASSLLSKKRDASSSSGGNKKPKVGYGDDVPPSRALGEPLRPAPEACPPAEPPAPAVEDVGAAEELQDSQVLVRSIDSVFDQFIGKYLLITWISIYLNKQLIFLIRSFLLHKNQNEKNFNRKTFSTKNVEYKIYKQVYKT